MNTLLRSYLSTHAAEDTLFVLWGFSSEDAGLARPSLDALLQQRLSRYLSSLLQQNPCVITAEEFALHADTLAQEFPHIILVQNTCYRTLLPVSVTLTPEMQSGLLSHFDPETPQDTPLPGIEPCLRVYSNLLHTEEGIACCIPLDALLRQYPQVERVSFGAAPHTVPETSAISSAFALTGEADYFCLVQQLRRGKTLCVSADSFIGDEAGLAASLAALAGAFPGQLSRAHAQTMQPERPVCPEARTLLQQHWGYPDFLPLDVYDLDALHRGEKKLRTITQEDIIDDLIQQAELCRAGQTYRDLFVTASTGAGKSVMFQIPAIDLAEKYVMVTLVISPLIGLMNDQVQGMEKHRYAKARTINSDIPPMVKKTIAQEVQEGRCDILYLSPESLLSRSDISDLIGDRAIGLLIVDEAHGAHRPFGGKENGFPEPALSMGADVVIQSLHKTLPCFTQTAVLHMKGDLADRERICRYLGMFQSSSPSYVFMAAMEQCIRFMDGDGRREMAAYGKRLERFFQQVKDLRNLKVLDWEKIVEADHSRKAGAAPGTISVYGWDPSKIVISCKRVWFKNVSGERQRLSGEALGNILRERYHLEMEMCAPEYVIGMTSVMDTEEGLLRLEKALWELDQELDTEPESVSGRTGEGHGDRGLSELPQPPLRLSPAEAMEMPGIRKRLSESAGSVSREFIYLYPPGIPVLAPGEEITEDVLERAAWYEAMGLSVQGLEDPSLSNIITVAEK